MGFDRLSSNSFIMPSGPRSTRRDPVIAFIALGANLGDARQAVEVAFDDEAAAFENINTRDELHRFDAAGPAHPNP